MKKFKIQLCVLFCIMLCLVGCGQPSAAPPIWEPQPSDESPIEADPNTMAATEAEPEIPSTTPGFSISGKYVCSSNYYDDKFFGDNPLNVPFIIFSEDWKCIFGINYFEGFSIVKGRYNIDGNQIYVELDFKGTVFVDNDTAEEYIPTRYTFNIVSNDEVVIDKDCYGVNTGDSFIRPEKQSASLTTPVVLPGNVFPHGKWTINQLIEKYGHPENIVARSEPYGGHRTVHVSIAFKDLDVSLKPFPISNFSFYNETMEEDFYSDTKEYNLNETDKNMEIDVHAVYITDVNLELPHNIQIGQSTKPQVIAAHPDDAYDIYKNTISYAYSFCGENDNLSDNNPVWYGFISFRFNEDDVLEKVWIVWN